MPTTDEVRDRPVPITLEESVQLGTLAFGELELKFPAAMREIIKNIVDLKRPAKGKRQIIFTITFEPDEDRAGVEYDVAVATKLQNERPAKSKLYIVGQGNEMVVTDSRPDSPQLSFK